MKKIFVILILFSLVAFCENYSAYCPQHAIKPTLEGKFASVSGLNFLAKTIAQNKISSLLKKETNSKFDVKITPIWGVNILKGEFQSFEAFAKNYAHSGIYAHDLKINTICSYNKVSFKNKVKFDYGSILKFSFVVEQQDLNKILNESEYKKFLDNLNTLNLVKIKNQDVLIKDNHLVFNYKIIPFGLSAINLSFKSKLKVQNNKIELSDIKLKNINQQKFLKHLVNFKIDLNKSQRADIKVENVEIKEGKIFLDGFVIVD